VVDVRVNGELRQVPDGSTVADLIESLGFGSRQVVVERNGEAVERARFAEVSLGPGDAVEVVRAVAGG
jgi:sulfur carrier protein